MLCAPACGHLHFHVRSTQGLHGIDVSNAKPTVDALELPVCFVCEIENAKIPRACEYWDAAAVARQLGLPDRDRQ